MMADKPIIFSGPMVNALLAGRKTQTRRILKPQPPDGLMPESMAIAGEAQPIGAGWSRGDRLWVRETCAIWNGEHHDIVYRADETSDGWEAMRHDARLGFWKIKSSIHMPRWASRLTLTVTDVRVQRLQEISEADAMAEGVDAVIMDDVPRQAAMSRRSDFAALWNSIHGPEAWDANPWVVALTFAVHKRNIDSVEAAA